MSLSEAIKRLNELELKFEGLKDNMQLYQDNINNGIYWLIGLLGIFVALLGVVAVALYFIAQTAVNKGVTKGINDSTAIVQKELSSIRSEFLELKKSNEQKIAELEGAYETLLLDMDQRVIQLIINNTKIKWARGTLYNTSNNDIYVSGLNGSIDWDSLITNVRILEPVSKKEVPFELTRKMDNGFAVKINNNTSFTSLEWVIIWYEKPIN